MQQLESWKKTYDKICTNFRVYSRIISSHGEEQPEKEELSSAADEFEAVKKNFEDVKESLENADREREIFSNHKSSGEKLDYPHFYGATSEDVFKFKFREKVIKAFSTNEVAKSEQVNKLRKVVSRFTLSLVPEITASIEKALSTL